MIREGRVIKIEYPYTLMTFSICDNYRKYAEKDLFDYMDHDPNGAVCFVETFICKEMNIKILRNLEKAITDRYPNVKYAVWYRPENIGERVYTYKRRYYEKAIRH